MHIHRHASHTRSIAKIPQQHVHTHTHAHKDDTQMCRCCVVYRLCQADAGQWEHTHTKKCVTLKPIFARMYIVLFLLSIKWDHRPTTCDLSGGCAKWLCVDTLTSSTWAATMPWIILIKEENKSKQQIKAKTYQFDGAVIVASLGSASRSLFSSCALTRKRVWTCLSCGICT